MHINKRVIPPRGKAVTMSVREPEAQHEQKAIPIPNKSPPITRPKLIGCTDILKPSGPPLRTKSPAFNIAVRANINIRIRISFVEPVLYALFALPAKPKKARVKR